MAQTTQAVPPWVRHVPQAVGGSSRAGKSMKFVWLFLFLLKTLNHQSIVKTLILANEQWARGGPGSVNQLRKPSPAPTPRCSL
jgi:hypothetical protein